MDFTFESVIKLLWCDHSNETSQAALYMELLFLSTFYQNLVEVLKVKALRSNTSDSTDEIKKGDKSKWLSQRLSL